MEAIFTVENLIALVTLTAIEIVLGIDNIVFIAILTGRVKKEAQDRVRRIGLVLAMVMRILLLLSITWVMSLTRPLFSVLENEISGRDIILIVGGLFLIAKATHEIHKKVEGGFAEIPGDAGAGRATVRSVLIQIILLDLVFSLDSVITAVGMAQSIWVMITAVVISVGVMLAFAGAISRFVERHPTVKMLALSFLVLIGVVLVGDGLGHHVPKGYVYFAMAFSLGVELLNIRAGTRASRKKPAPTL